MVVHVEPDRNIIYAKTQDSVILCASQDVRPADRTWCLEAHQVFSASEDESTPEFHLLQALNQLSIGQTADLMVVQNRDNGWTLTRHASEWYMAYRSILHLAVCWFDLHGCCVAELGHNGALPISD